MTDLVTDFNEAEYRLRFSVETGHSMECIEHTIDEMLFQFGTMSYNMGLSEEEGLDLFITKMPVVVFDIELLKLLSVKECDCDQHKQIN